MDVTWMEPQPNHDLEVLALKGQYGWMRLGITWLNPIAGVGSYTHRNDLGVQVKVRRLLVEYRYAR